ncbi:MAG: flagellar biosynthesis protein FlgD [Buchnera aphidicola (Microlophium carnosum)]|uniref:Basal-body rod modification protein FlgD n=1 Tax=Buchnera aphidicola (Microlophium carnosum) TaxID=2708354 RepID=A0A6G9JV30_9GAMM|nr:MAG: flagellar biosynthesis protein FlgD [Buchnera aphidicola (Microlophium carnosum)]
MNTINTNLTNVNPPVHDDLIKNNSNYLQDNTNSLNLQKNFLKLLVTQIKNQDPTDPIKNSDLTSQLAQINTANGIERLNNFTIQFSNHVNKNQNLQLSSLIGRHVIVPNEKIIHSKNTKTRFGIALFDNADSVKIEITDKNNTVLHVKKITNVEPGIHTFLWDGKDLNDQSVDTGKYNIVVVAQTKGEDIRVKSLSEAVVNSVIMSANIPIIKLGEAGTTTPLNILEILT